MSRWGNYVTNHRFTPHLHHRGARNRAGGRPSPTCALWYVGGGGEKLSGQAGFGAELGVLGLARRLGECRAPVP